MKNMFAIGWDTRSGGTLVKGVHDKVDWTLTWEYKHLFKAFCQSTITRLCLAIVISFIQTFFFLFFSFLESFIVCLRVQNPI